MLFRSIKGLAERTRRPGLLEGIGGFASLFSLKDFMAVAGAMEDPVLVSGSDGVGTKLQLAFRTPQPLDVPLDELFPYGSDCQRRLAP